MTSTNVNIGIEGRTSSRVLKPPGGGHTDIFGSIPDNLAARNAKRDPNKSAISQCFYYEGGTKAETNGAPVNNKAENLIKIDTVKEENLKNGNHENGVAVVNDENVQPNQEPIVLQQQQTEIVSTIEKIENAPEVAPSQQKPQKVRVPPGGFSSGFW